MDGLDPVDIAAIAIAAVSVIALAVVIVWPFGRLDDVLQYVHRDQPQLPQ